MVNSVENPVIEARLVHALKRLSNLKEITIFLASQIFSVNSLTLEIP